MNKNKIFNNKSILITGGTGSFGKCFIETVLKKYHPRKLICFSRDELKQFEMHQKLKHLDKKKVLRFFIGDVRDKERLDSAFRDVNIVIHAAALKQVVAAEDNPFEVVKTNVLGTQNVAEAILKNPVEKGIFLSTDKAVSPINLYGATKLAAEKLFISSNAYNAFKKFSVVRYGNVFFSRGSVVPTIIKNDTFELTDEQMTRFNISLQDAVNLVINSINRMWGGETFIPKMPSLKIVDLFKALSKTKKMKKIGIRPGEKIHEQLISKNDSSTIIEFKDYFVILPTVLTHINWKLSDFIKKSGSTKGKMCKRFFEYHSGNNSWFLNQNEIKKIYRDQMNNMDYE